MTKSKKNEESQNHTQKGVLPDKIIKTDNTPVYKWFNLTYRLGAELESYRQNLKFIFSSLTPSYM